MTTDSRDRIKLAHGEDWVQMSVRIQAGASSNEIAGVMEGCLKIRLAAPPAQGKANRALQSFLAKRLGIPKGCVEITSGHTTRNKRIRLRGVSLSFLCQRLPEIR